MSQQGYKLMVPSQKIANPDGTPTREFYQFLNNLAVAAGTGGPAAAVTVGPSPFQYTPAVMVYAVVTGGTVSDLSMSRDGGTTFIELGITAGQVTLEAQDILQITWSGTPPTLTAVPA